MPKKATVKRNWPKKNAPMLISFSHTVATKVDSNPNFPEPPVPSQDLETMANTLQAIYNNRKNGLYAKELFKSTMVQMNDMLATEADYINNIANGDIEIITSAGFDFTKTTKSKPALPQIPKAPSLENVNGKLNIKTETIKGADSYCWLVFIGQIFPLQIVDGQLAFDSGGKVRIVTSGTTRESVGGIEPGTRVYVQVMAQNTSGKSAFSNAATICIA